MLLKKASYIDHERMVSVITAWGVQWTGLRDSPKTNGDHLIEDNLDYYCTKNFEMAKRKKERGIAVPLYSAVVASVVLALSVVLPPG